MFHRSCEFKKLIFSLLQITHTTTATLIWHFMTLWLWMKLSRKQWTWRLTMTPW